MLTPTHSVFGIFLTLIVLAVFGVQSGLHWSIFALAILGAIAPDIDHPKSMIGRIFKSVSLPIERKFGHRSVTHSFIGLLFATLIFGLPILLGNWGLRILSNFGFGISDFSLSYIESFATRWIAAFSIGYLSHLLLDMFNRRGSQMFWPNPNRDVIPRNPKLRSESGSRVEIVIFVILLSLMFLAFPISKYGLISSLRWFLATPGSAIEEFKTLNNHAYLEFDGVFKDRKENVKGEAEILDVDYKCLVILYKGDIYTLSDQLAADILASHVRVKKTNIPIKIERKEFINMTREYLLSQIPKGALISGTIHLPEGMDIKISPSSSAYKTIEQKGNDLILHYSTKGQIEKLGLTKSFEIQRRKDLAELSKLQAEAIKTQKQITKINKIEGLTQLGRELLLDMDKTEKQEQQLIDLNNKLEEINIKREEVKLKIHGNKFIFSGEVYIRQ
ncbi:metal-dependent hydrolase [Patescibacteria group bacterium]|nr:metal-dependent hydrolase [Patescibacteria group bacterium]